MDKAASDWKLVDLDAVVAINELESSRFELKKDLPLSDGALGWRAKRKLHASERDGIAREVVSFANLYGGAIVVGIEEAADAPSRASQLAPPLPAVFDLADRLRDALASIIDPPISGLEIAAIPSSGDPDSGYLVITVPPSPNRPHGYGHPPQVFVRRDDNADPASMQEINAMFWEARTNRERIDGELARATALLDDFQPQADLNFQFVAVSGRAVAAVHLPEAMLSGKVIASRGSYNTFVPGDAAAFPNNYQSWQPNATGVDFSADERNSRQRGSTWAIDETGIVTVTGSNNLPNAENGEMKEVYPAWYAKTCGSLIGLVQLFSRWQGYEGAWVVAWTFQGPSRVLAREGGPWREGRIIDLSSTRRMRPVRISRVALDAELRNLSAKIWSTFGLLLPDDEQAIQNGLKYVQQFEVKGLGS